MPQIKENVEALAIIHSRLDGGIFEKAIKNCLVCCYNFSSNFLDMKMLMRAGEECLLPTELQQTPQLDQM